VNRQRGPLGGISSVLANPSFLYLWTAQGLSQIALNATIYILLVRVEEWTGSSIAVSYLILSFIVPSVIMGVAAGVFVDRWPKKQVLITTNLLRAVIVAAFVVLAQNLLLVVLVNLAYSIVSQFFLPAEAASIPQVVEREDLLVANGLFNITMSGAQLLGFVFIGPLMTKSMSSNAAFLSLASVYAGCSLLIGFIRLPEPALVAGEDLARGWLHAVRLELQEGWRLLAQDTRVSLSVSHLTFINSLILVIGMLAPGYVSRVLNIRADDAVFVMAPAGLGMLLGIALLPRLSLRWPKEVIAVVGIFASAWTLLALGAVGVLQQPISQWEPFKALADATHLESAGLVAIVAFMALVFGFGYASVNVAAQTLVHENVPLELRGRIFATQFAFANAAAVAPLLFMGGLADRVGIVGVTFIGALLMLSYGIFTAYRMRDLHMVVDRAEPAVRTPEEQSQPTHE